MQNVSIPVPRQNDLFDAEPESNLTLPNTPALPEAHSSALLPVIGRSRKGRISVNTKLAVALSLLLHVALILVLSAGGMPSQPQVIHQTLHATWVTWADASSLLEKKRDVAGAVHAPPAAAAGGRKDFIKVKAPAEAQPDVASGEDTKTAMFLDVEQKSAAAKASDSPPVSLETGAAEQKRVVHPAAVSPSAGLTAPASSTSMAKPRYRDNAPPVYPQPARLRGQEGVVLLHAEILPEGRTGVLKIKTSSGYDLLDQSALDTVRSWRFEPARRMGQPVAVWVDIPVRFVLKKSD